MGKKVSVIIPTHNRSDLLRRAIRSVLAQDHSDFEILIADDASDEDIASVAREFADARIKHLRNDQKSHAGGARNLGLEHATGEYIAFLDSDDEWLENHLSSRIQAIEQTASDGTFGSVFIDDGTERTYHGSKAIAPGQHPADYILSGGSIPTPTWVMKAAAAKSLRFDAGLIIHEDYDFFVRFADRFKWYAMWEPTTIVHWTKGVQRKRNPQSEILFVQRHYRHISQRAYFMYHLSNLTDYKRLGAAEHVLKYYQREALRYINAISFNDYCALFPGRSGLAGFAQNLIAFNCRILAGKFRKPGPPEVLS